MSDQVFNANAGFFSAVSGDREYYATDLNRPYKRLVSNGVFATQRGTPSTDLQVLQGTGMGITVQPGQGIFADKWFELSSAQAITVPNNTSTSPRLDSVLVQIDNRISGRVGSIVYRTGTASNTPSAPAINTVTDVVEYRVANILVNPGATAIYQSNIYDLRGSSECPWITSLVQQVDISTLFTQYQDAYKRYFETSTSDFEDYEEARKDDWDAFIESLTDDLTVSTNVITIRSSYTTTGTATLIPVGIPSYNPSNDVLLVYINGLLADTAKYTYLNSNQIRLTNPLSMGQLVSFVCFKSVIGGNLSTVSTLIAQLNQRITELSQDSGWINLTLSGNATAYNESNVPAIRCIGNRVYLRGCIKGETEWNATVGSVPVAYKPAHRHIITTTAIYGSSCIPVNLQITADGDIKTLAFGNAISAAAMIPLDTEYSI